MIEFKREGKVIMTESDNGELIIEDVENKVEYEKIKLDKQD